MAGLPSTGAMPLVLGLTDANEHRPIGLHAPLWPEPQSSLPIKHEPGVLPHPDIMNRPETIRQFNEGSLGPRAPVQDGLPRLGPAPDQQFMGGIESMSVEQIRERTQAMKEYLEASEKIRQMERKRPREESVDEAASDTQAAKHARPLKLPKLQPSYMPIDREALSRYFDMVQDNAKDHNLDDDELVAYAITGLPQAEVDLWETSNRPDGHSRFSWLEFRGFMKGVVDVETRHKRASWQTLLAARKREDEDDKQWGARFTTMHRELGHEAEDIKQVWKNLFLRGLDGAMYEKVMKEDKIPDDFRDLVSLTVKLRPEVEADRSERIKISPRRSPEKFGRAPSFQPAYGNSVSTRLEDRVTQHGSAANETPTAPTGPKFGPLHCFKCNGRGHIKRNCPKKKQKQGR
ncbi:hypothetical protein FQN50_000523 [Emmonsiellopsis sp. PD_5]|nr:hypothetical protein FQN50_000523 [Emmonsiellopsis sp. PD_5]